MIPPKYFFRYGQFRHFYYLTCVIIYNQVQCLTMTFSRLDTHRNTYTIPSLRLSFNSSYILPFVFQNKHSSSVIFIKIFKLITSFKFQFCIWLRLYECYSVIIIFYSPLRKIIICSYISSVRIVFDIT